MTSVEERLTVILDTFDSFDLDKEYRRRASVKPLYDYFQTLVLEVAVRFCGLSRNVLGHYFLLERWKIITDCLGEIEDPNRWDEMISALHHMRTKTEHTPYKCPSKTALLQIRQRVPEFRDWIISVGKQYYGESKGFSIIQRYSILSRLYIGQADWMIYLFGNEIPYCAEKEFALPGEEHSYERLKPLRDAIESRNREIKSIQDLSQEDLINLAELIKITERLDARESVFLQQNICPKCGGKITQTQRAIGGSEDSMPYAVVYRIGCKDCDYEIDSETIDI